MTYTESRWYFFGCLITILLAGKSDGDRRLATFWIKKASAKLKQQPNRLEPAELAAFGLGRVDMAISISKRRAKGR